MWVNTPSVWDRETARNRHWPGLFSSSCSTSFVLLTVKGAMTNRTVALWCISLQRDGVILPSYISIGSMYGICLPTFG